MKRALVLWAALAGGCVSQTGLGRAETLPDGASQAGVGIETQLALVNSRAGPEDVPVPWAQLQVGYRRGVAERTEAGVRAFGLSVPRLGLTSFGAVVDSKYQVRRRDHGWDVALDAALGYHQVRFGTPWHFPSLTLAAIFGRDFGRHSFVLGPRAGYGAWLGAGQSSIHLFYFGGAAGFDFRIGSSFHLAPEIVAFWSPVSFNGEATDADRLGATTIQIGLGGAFDL